MRPNHARRTPDSSKNRVVATRAMPPVEREDDVPRPQPQPQPLGPKARPRPRGRPRRNNNDHGASGSREPHAIQREQPRPRIAPGTEIASDGGPAKLHFILAKPGADIIGCILGLTEVIKMGVVILSALGTVSKAVMVRNMANLVHEGCFQIASLSGTCLPGEPIGRHSDITVLLSDRTGAVIGGVVESLIAQSNIQIVVAGFSPDIAKPIDLPAEAA